MANQVLFVDDEPSITDGIRLALRKAPFEVLVANSASQALRLLEQQNVDVIVSDERMPDMSGSELLSRVREDYPDTMRLILSGQADLQGAIRAINEGAVFRFLMKPCDPHDLASSVEEALVAQRARRRFKNWKEDHYGCETDPSQELDRAHRTVKMAFQPIYTSSDTSIYAYEALVRLTDPDITRPDQLFGLSEALTRVPETDQVIRRAIADRMEDLPEDALVFVNVHPATLQDDRLFDELDPLRLHAQKVVLEITERTSLLETDEVEERIQHLRDLDFRIALDDLGSGYAGLTSFARLLPDVVKFDMSLVRDIDRDPTRARLVRSMAALCQEMETLTVAEGIETYDEMCCVADLGCDLLQGYYLGRPAFEFQDRFKAA